ncbi:rhomboid family intramembrane serine protease [Hyalangium versicolor]|uniref:rhomboid family intramembrane serine protease n=1 Tax=Hyalangium versicolor TaxID=2861190 RepID=UPI001CC9F951|nr:rhomboid family intramembrane serine protease [Hyalangium versicolor]
MARSPRILDPSPGESPPPEQPQSAPQPRPRWTPVCGTLIASCVVLYLLGHNHLLPALSSKPDGMELAQSGIPLALYGPLVQQGEYWRLLSCVFEHGSPFHLLFNMMVVYSLGFMLERSIGSWRFLGLCFVTALGGSALSLFVDFDRPMVGASGMILGWAGVMLPIATEQGRRQLGIWLVQMVVISLIPGVSWAGHLGGFLFGLPCGIALKLGRAVYARALPLILFITAVVAMFAAHPERRWGF